MQLLPVHQTASGKRLCDRIVVRIANDTELRKVRKRRDQIFTYRERKLALLASSRASGAEVEVPHLTTQELALFESMVALLKKSRAEAFGASAQEAETIPQTD